MRFARQLGRRPRKLALRGTDLLREYGQIVVGASPRAPAKGDRRFTDPAWIGNPLLHRVLQAYLAIAQAVETVVTDAHLDYRDNLRVRLFPGRQPHRRRGAQQQPGPEPGGVEVRHRHRRSQPCAGRHQPGPGHGSRAADPYHGGAVGFRVGKTVAVTPGAVVRRLPMFELIQYTSQTETVSTVPLLIVPPVINKYYAIDLAPGRSLIEYLVAQGQQVFVISWRNPDARHRSWGIDAYGQAILDGLDAVLQIADVEQAHLAALCSGGIIAAMLAVYLSEAGGLDRLSSVGLAVTVLDQSRAGTAGALIDERVAKMAVVASARRGYLDGRSLAEVFAWLRPNDLIWNYWVNGFARKVHLVSKVRGLHAKSVGVGGR